MGLVADVKRAVLACGSFDESLLADQKMAERIPILALRMSKADTREDWEATANELDALEGNEVWKFDNASGCPSTLVSFRWPRRAVPEPIRMASQTPISYKFTNRGCTSARGTQSCSAKAVFGTRP